MRPGSHGDFFSRCGPGSGTSLHSIVYHWNASWSFLSHGGTPQIHPSSPFSIGFYMKFTIRLLGYLHVWKPPNGAVEILWDGAQAGARSKRSATLVLQGPMHGEFFIPAINWIIGYIEINHCNNNIIMTCSNWILTIVIYIYILYICVCIIEMTWWLGWSQLVTLSRLS